jgi:hypothetical protein
VRLLLILSQVLNLSAKQVDYTAVFIHAPKKLPVNGGRENFRDVLLAGAGCVTGGG